MEKELTIHCGHYSYAEMIKKFDKIFGVTGTLESLNTFEKSVLQKYDIKCESYAPSVYGESRVKINPILIEKN